MLLRWKVVNPICLQLAWLYKQHKLVKKVVWPQEAKKARILISALCFTLYASCCLTHVAKITKTTVLFNRSSRTLKSLRGVQFRLEIHYRILFEFHPRTEGLPPNYAIRRTNSVPFRVGGPPQSSPSHWHYNHTTLWAHTHILASFPGLPHFWGSSVCVQYNTRKWKGGEKHGMPVNT